MEISEKEYRDLVARAVVAEEKNKFMTNEIKDIRNTLHQIQSTLNRFTAFFGSFNKTPESTTIPAYELTKATPINHNYEAVTIAHDHTGTTGTITGGKAPSTKYDTSALHAICSTSELAEMYALHKMEQCGVSPLDLAKLIEKNKTEK